MKEITPGLPVKVVVDVLRQASKVSAVHLISEKWIAISPSTPLLNSDA